MAFQPSFNSRVLIGSFSFSAYVNDVQFPTSTNMLDVTVLTNTAKTFIPGQVTSTASLKGFLDPDTTSLGQYDQLNTFSSSPLAYGPSGFAFGSELFMVTALKTLAGTHAGAAGAVEFDLACQTGLHTDFGRSLHDLTAETADGSSAAYDGGAASTTGGVAQLHVSAFSGLTSNVVIVEDSATGSSGWATIATFSTVTALTSERVTIAGTIRRYTRCSYDVTGSGSTTFQVGIARR